MRRILIWAAVFGALTSFVQASDRDTALRALDLEDEARQWASVGRVNLINGGFCTGALIRPDVVLTAAHCFFDKQSGDRLPDSDVRFVAGFKEGTAQAIRGARRVVIDTEYDFRDGVTDLAIGRDLAVIQLDQPIVSDRMQPFETARRPALGDQVSVVSYAQGRATKPSIQDVCRVVGERKEVLVLSCSVTFGASGSPIFAVSEDGPQLVSVVSATAFMNGSNVSLSVVIDDRLTGLLATLDGGIAAKKTRAGRKSLAEQLGRSSERSTFFKTNKPQE